MNTRYVDNGYVPSLQFCHLDLTILQEKVQRELKILLSEVKGRKSIICEETLWESLKSIIPSSWLKKYQIVNSQPLTSTRVECEYHKDVPAYFFFVRGRNEKITKMINQIKFLIFDRNEKEKNKNKKLKIVINVIPTKTGLIAKRINESAISKHIAHINSFGMSLVPIDSNLITCSMARSLHDIAENDVIKECALSIAKFEKLFGEFTKKTFIGKHSHEISQILFNDVYKSFEIQGVSFNTSEIENSFPDLIVIDRSVDMISPFLTPITFEGIIDSLYGIKPNGVFDMKQVNGEQNDKILFRDDNQLVKETRFVEISYLTPLLKTTTQECKNIKDDISDMSSNFSKISQIPQLGRFFLDKKKTLSRLLDLKIDIDKTMKTHQNEIMIEQYIILGVQEKKVAKYIETLIESNESIYRVLRLLSLMSQVDNGVSQKTFKILFEKIMSSYKNPDDFQLMMTLERELIIKKRGVIDWKIRPLKKLRNLFHEKIFKEKNSSWYSEAKKNLKLVSDEETKNDIGYVFGGIAPISVMIVKKYIENQKGFGDLLCDINVENHTYLCGGGGDEEHEEGENEGDDDGEKKKIVVFFVGGVCRAEIASLKKLEEISNVQIIIMTSEIISSKHYLKQYMHSTKKGEKM